MTDKIALDAPLQAMVLVDPDGTQHAVADINSVGSSANVEIHDPNTLTNKLAIDGSGQIGVNNQPDVSALATEATLAGLEALLQPVRVSGTLASAGDTLVLAIGGRPYVGFWIDGAANLDGAVVLEPSFDGGATYQTGVNLDFIDPSGGGVWRSTINPNVYDAWWWVQLLPGMTHIRAHATAATSGTAAVVLMAAATGTAIANSEAVNPSWDGVTTQPPMLTMVGAKDASNAPAVFSLGPAGGLTTESYTAHHAASTVTIATGIGSIAPRATRTACSLFCPSANAADVLIDGVFPVPKGIVFPVNSVDQIDFTGTNDDVVRVLEVYN